MVWRKRERERPSDTNGLRRNLLSVVLLFKSQATWGSAYSRCRARFLPKYTRAVVSSFRVYDAYVSACIMQESRPRLRNIFPPRAYHRPKCIHPIIFASPSPARPARSFLVAPQLFLLLLSIFAGAFAWNAFIWNRPFFRRLLRPPLLLSSPPCSLCLFFAHFPAMLVYAVTSSGSLCRAVNPTEDTRNVTCVVENWFG